MVIITVSGLPGSGKTTLVKSLLANFGFEYHNSGQHWREKYSRVAPHLPFEEWWASLSLEDNLAEDCTQISMIQLAEKNYLWEARYSAIACIKNNVGAFKVFLTADLDTRAKRVAVREGGDPAALREVLERRLKDEVEVCRKLYGVDFTERKHYDVYLDTSSLDPVAVLGEVAKAVASYVQNHLLPNL